MTATAQRPTRSPAAAARVSSPAPRRRKKRLLGPTLRTIAIVVVVLLFVLPLGWMLMAALDRKSTRLNSSHLTHSRMPSSA